MFFHAITKRMTTEYDEEPKMMFKVLTPFSQEFRLPGVGVFVKQTQAEGMHGVVSRHLLELIPPSK